MAIVDLLIVYLACGSPFAVYEATTREIGTRTSRSARAMFALAFWPVLAFNLIKGHTLQLFHGRQSPKDLKNIRQSIEASLFPDGASVGIFEFRDVFHRFAGLDEASLEKPSTATFEIFKVVNHPNGALASRILGRTNLRKIEAHRLRAQQDFEDVLERNIPSDFDADVRDAVARLSPTLQIPAAQKPSIAPSSQSRDKLQAHV